MATSFRTKGVKEMSVQEDGTFKLVFHRAAGPDIVVTLPATGVGVLAAGLTKMHRAARPPRLIDEPGGEIDMSHALRVVGFATGGDDKGDNFVLVVQTEDGLELRYSLSRQHADGIRRGLQDALYPGGLGQPTQTSTTKN